MGETGPAAPDGLAAPERETRGPGGRGVLVVDDEPAVRHLVQSVLRSAGYAVTTAAGGREALRAIYGESATPGLVVTDLDMPGMSGVELATRLTVDRPGVRIVLMTSDVESADRARARPFVAAVLIKPFTASDLRDVVRSVLGEPAPAS
ncbi:MAG TPA: response regulator [Candidatus Limnocylindrales bacterium]